MSSGPDDLLDGTGFKLAIVIVNFRTADLVMDCLASLHVPGTVPSETRVIVVDGASGDGSAERISATIIENGWVDTTSLALEVNGGFAYGNNRGIEYARANFGDPRYVLLLNPDTVARPGSITRLVEFMDANGKAGIAGSRLEHPDGRGQACAFRFPSIANEFESEAKLGPVTRLLDRWRIAPDMPREASRIDWVSGASMLIRTDVLNEVGYLDEGYFLYYEELDFCLRAARAGWPCWHVPESRVVHLVGQSTGVTRHDRPSRRPVYWFESRRRYYLKHKGAVYAIIADLAWLAGHLLWRTRLLVEGRNGNAPPHILQDFIRHAGPFRGA
ncbi:glycosyltransferase family 2 protein [Rhizobium sp. LCM 4573]|uniref:glycosyltransferase family 2 protein n=1 Tax=Rhizobium sp. LCM 4573 TaxID=1848291 RepID=UPI0008DAF157|nr:glycosyltransferase family 2 protein [Rhizobium sp. LCM 4573]OHV84992.1 glycosyl transferase family 2 [Rhizobium sp. LCM 4573]